MSAPSPRLLSLLLSFIGATLLAWLGSRLGVFAAVVFGLIGSVAGWIAARYVIRRLF